MDAEKTAPEIARDAAALIGVLFAVEREAKEPSIDELWRLRQEQSAPVLANPTGGRSWPSQRGAACCGASRSARG